MKGLPIEIVGDHPHAGDRGVLVSAKEAEKMGRQRHIGNPTDKHPHRGSLVALDNCPHGADSCYVWPGEFRTGCERRP